MCFIHIFANPITQKLYIPATTSDVTIIINVEISDYCTLGILLYLQLLSISL